MRSWSDLLDGCGVIHRRPSLPAGVDLASPSIAARGERGDRGGRNKRPDERDRPKQPNRCQPKPAGDINCGGLRVCPLARNPTRLKAIASKTPKVEATAEAPFVEIRTRTSVEAA